jgi:hypothetical protein
MSNIERNINFFDRRGYIIDIFYKENYNHATLIYSKKNSIRGNHFHKKTTQATFVLNGSCTYYYKSNIEKKIKKIKLKKFSYIITKPYEYHAYKFHKVTNMLIFSKGLRGGRDYEKDTFRLVKSMRLIT